MPFHVVEPSLLYTYNITYDCITRAYHTLAPDMNFCCRVLACMMHLSISCTMVFNYPVIFCMYFIIGFEK